MADTGLGSEAIPPTLIAYLCPDLNHEKTIALMRHIYDNQDQLTEPQKQFVRPAVFDPFENYSFAAGADDLDDEFTYAKLLLDFTNISSGGSKLGFTIGLGSSSSGEADRGTALCLGFDGKNTNGVAPRHGIIYYHPVSGALMIEGTHAINPIIYTIDGRKVPLYQGQSRMILFPENDLSFGALHLKLEVPERSDQALVDFLDYRDECYRINGLKLPDPRLHSFPAKEPFIRIGPAVILPSSLGGSRRYVKAGIHHVTGEPMGIKIIDVGAEYSWRQATHLINASFAFYGQKGLIQASEVRCGNGCSVTAEEYRRGGWESLHFCKHQEVTIYILYPLAKKDFSCHDWKEATVEFIMQMARSFLRGVKNMHAKVCMHRDIKESNVLMMSVNPPKAALCGFSSVFDGPRFHTTNFGTPALHAPEVASGRHTNKIDIWNCGLVMCAMLLSDDYDRYIDREGRQGAAWNAHMVRCLDDFGRLGKVQDRIAKVVTLMISRDPGQRPTAQQVLTGLPLWNRTRAQWRWSKKVKFLEKISRPVAPAPVGDDTSESSEEE